MAVSTAHIFMTGGGTKRWETDERVLTSMEVVDMYLTPNGFKGSVICVKGDTVYFQVDTESMDMGNFYTWAEMLAKGEEVPHDIDIWRPFFWIGEAGGKPGVADEYCWGDEKPVGPSAYRDPEMNLHEFWCSVATTV